MAKKKSEKEKTSQNTNEQFDNSTQFNTEICKLKHIAIDKEFQSLKTDADKKHEELVRIIQTSQDNIKEDVRASNANLKDKIVLTEKIIGDKIDSLSEFDDTLKGNGTPGIWESIRSINRMIKIICGVLLIIIILELGGSWNRINWESIRKKFGISPETKQVESEEKEIKIGTMEDDKSSFVPEEKTGK